MPSFNIRSMKTFAVVVTLAALVAVAAPSAVAAIGQRAVNEGTEAASSAEGYDMSTALAVSDGAVELIADPRIPSDTAPKCAKPGTPPRLWPVGSTPYGHSYNEWTQDWWRWALSLPPAINPIVDPNGDSCAYGQHGPVWFLAGNFGGTMTRSCSIGCNKAIFLPVINCEWENGWVGNPILSIEELRAICAGAGMATGVTLEVDGIALPAVQRNRVESDIFDYSMGPDNLGGQPQGVYFPTISDGIWAMLDPLPPGRHTVRFTVPDFLDITYELNVVALELPCSSPSCP